jgi:hypothetical protein
MDINFEHIPLGVVDSPEDTRDYTLETFGVDAFSNIPDEYIIPFLPNVYNQGSTSMCVGFSLAEIKEAQELKERNTRKKYSPGFIYSNREVTDHQGEGMIPRQALHRLTKFGTCDFDNFNITGNYSICRNAFNEQLRQLIPLAIGQKISAYVRLKSIIDLKTFLLKYQTPALITIQIFSSFYQTGSNGIISPPSGTQRGGHGMVAIGWRLINNKEYLVIQNSWGTTWGSGGIGYLPVDDYPLKEMWGVIDDNLQMDIDQPLKIDITVGVNECIVDDKTMGLRLPSVYYNGLIYLPLTFIEDVFKYKTSWFPSGSMDGTNDRVIIQLGGEKEEF